MLYDPVMRHSPLTGFALLASCPEEAMDLESLCLSIARIRTPDLQEAPIRAELDRLSAELADEAAPSLPPDRIAEALRRGLGLRAGFHGDPDDYVHVEASMLDQVVLRRRGLPILLSIVYMLIGQRLRLPVRGVARPGHFIVCLDAPGARIYLDPFRGGARLDPTLLLEEVEGRRDLLAPARPRAILTRLLTNLKHLALSQERWQLGVDVADRLLLLQPDAPVELRDRGLFLIAQGRTREAAADLRRYLQLAPRAPDRPAMERLIARLDAGEADQDTVLS